MNRLLLALLPVALFAGQPRYARLGEFDGNVEVQLHPADPWSPAERNLTLRELAWLRSGPSSRLEIELDEGSAWRIGPDSQMEISDYSLLSSGQRLTVLSLDRGVAYFTGEPLGRDTLMVVAPGVQVTLVRGARVRLEAGVAESRVSVIEGVVRLSCPAAEIDLQEGQTVRVEPANPESFLLDRTVATLELDRWSEERDKVLAAPVSLNRVAQRFGVADLDASGEWIQTDLGAVWKPRVPEGWLPFQKGHWRWYDGLGYTWVGADTWGWLPYHFGRWTRKADFGWVWAPGTNAVFKPGDVYWLYGLRMAGWGPLAPGESWTGTGAPQQFLNTNTTWAAFPQDAALIDPAGFTGAPKEPLTVSVFRVALPSPAFLSARLEAIRPPLRVGSTHFMPVLPGTTFQDTNELPPPAPATPPAPLPVDSAPPPAGAPPYPGPSGPPMQTTYPVPVYTGVVVINPPDHPVYSQPNPNFPRPPAQPPSQPPTGSSQPVPRSVKLPDEARPTSGPRRAPAEDPKVSPPRQVRTEPAPKAEPSKATPTLSAPRTETPRPSPPPAPKADAPKATPTLSAPRTETPRPSPPAPKVEAPKADATKTDTSAKK
jgi:hypothetical protein